MKRPKIIIGTALFASLTITSCGDNGTKETISRETEKNETSTTQDIDTIKNEETIQTSKTEDEIKKMVKDFNKKKSENISIESGQYNDDELLDFFVKTTHVTEAELVYKSYFFYDSKTQKLSELKIKNGLKSIFDISINSYNQNQFNSTVTLRFQANDISVADQKTTAIFSIDDDQIVFDNKSTSNLKQADKRLEQEKEAAWNELEGDF